MLTIEEIKKELDAGNTVELECVDREGFVNTDSYSYSNREILSKKIFSVSIPDDGSLDILQWSRANMIGNLASKHLKYFRIKRPTPTFDDLIDVAVKAVRDKVLHSMQIGESKRKGRYINFSQNGNGANKAHYESDTAPYAVIEWINSLYTETFVIDEFKDTKKLKSEAKVILTNGEEVIFSNKSGADDSLWFEHSNCHSTIIPYIALKGATVTQKRGE